MTLHFLETFANRSSMTHVVEHRAAVSPWIWLFLNQPTDWRSKQTRARAVDQFKSIIQPAILVVDPDPVAAASIETLLKSKEHCVAIADGYTSAIKAVTREPFDLVITDESIIADTGVRLADLIHAIPDAADIPFLFTSQTQVPDVISRPNRDRNEFVIRKPFDHEAFLELVEYAMWMPHLIRSHILRMHQQQGLAQPHIEARTGQNAPASNAASPRLPQMDFGSAPSTPLSHLS